MTERIRYVFVDRVQRVEEKRLTVGAKLVDGQAKLFTESAGWYVTFGNLSFYVGQLEPAFKAGDKVRVTIEKLNKET
jgi:hypothetical protein